MTDIINVGIVTVDAIGKPIDKVPAPKELVLFDRLTMTTGGCAVNCAIDLGKMGIPNSLIVKLGTDMLGDFVADQAKGFGIDISKIIRERETNTPFTFVMVDSTGERRFVHTMGTNATLKAEELDLEFIARHKFCYIGGVMLMPALDGKPLAAALKKIRARGTQTLLDTVYVSAAQPRWREVILPMLSELDYFIPSEPEATAITGLTDPEAMAKFFQDQGGKNIVVKLGEKGVYYRKANGDNGYVKAYTVSKVEDTTGAGDSWDAGFLAGLSLGQTFPEACRLGNATAAFCIQAAGASTGIPSLQTIMEFQNKNKP
jgi:sugar/nucleoside kinase (ribokinase family)